jgi:hypothetical protein
LIEPGDERRPLEEMIDRSQSDFAAVVHHSFGGTANQFGHIVEALQPFRSLASQRIGKSGRVDDLGKHAVDAGVFGKVAEAINEFGKRAQRVTRRGAC